MLELVIRAVIFDMDGLMIDSEALQSRAFEEVLRHYGVTPEPSRGLVIEVGMGARDNWRRLRERYRLPADIEDLYEHKQRVYEEYLAAGMVTAMPGLMVLMRTWRSFKSRIQLRANERTAALDAA